MTVPLWSPQIKHFSVCSTVLLIT